MHRRVEIFLTNFLGPPLVVLAGAYAPSVRYNKYTCMYILLQYLGLVAKEIVISQRVPGQLKKLMWTEQKEKVCQSQLPEIYKKKFRIVLVIIMHLVYKTAA